MKFSGRQVLASAAGAVIAAVIASAFGVKGTIIGVAIGSAAATLGTAIVSQSIERGQEAMKQVVVRQPETSPLLRRLGGTRSSGGTASSVEASNSPTEVTPATGASFDEAAKTGAWSDATVTERVHMESPTAPVAETRRLDISAAATAPATERLQATTLPVPSGSQRFSWKAIAGTVVIVFVLALGFITAIELISGKPLAAIFGRGGSGTTLHNIISPPPASTTTSTTVPSTTTTTTSSSTTSSSTTTTTTSTTTTTTTAAPGGATTTAPASATTTTSGVGATTSTTGAGSTSVR